MVEDMKLSKFTFRCKYNMGECGSWSVLRNLRLDIWEISERNRSHRSRILRVTSKLFVGKGSLGNCSLNREEVTTKGRRVSKKNISRSHAKRRRGAHSPLRARSLGPPDWLGRHILLGIHALSFAWLARDHGKVHAKVHSPVYLYSFLLLTGEGA